MEDSRWPKIYQWTPHGRRRRGEEEMMEEPSDRLHEKQKHGRRYGRIFGICEWLDGSWLYRS